MTKPQLGENEEIGRFGANHVRQIIENGWRAIVQDFAGLNDRGLDFNVQDVNEGRVTGFQFNIQVKTSHTFLKSAGTGFRARVQKKHILLWRDSNVPVILVCVDLGPPLTAYWRLIRPDQDDQIVWMSRTKMFTPASRDAVVADISRGLPQRNNPTIGESLRYPLQVGLREAAKKYYRELIQTPHIMPNFGPVAFTWKGWRHMTRQGRSFWRIRDSLLLLPAIRPFLDDDVNPVRWRTLKTISRGGWDLYRTLLIFERVVTFERRVPAWVRVVLEGQATIPKDWQISPPTDPRRELHYKFLTISELQKPVDLGDLTGT